MRLGLLALDLMRFRFKERCATAISELLDFTLTMLRATGPLSRRFPPWPSDGHEQDERAVPKPPVKVRPQSFRQAKTVRLGSLLSPENRCRYGASSHSGRRTLLTNLARRCAQAGASLRDVQRIAGHADLGTTERYVEPSLEAQRRLIALT